MPTSERQEAGGGPLGVTRRTIVKGAGVVGLSAAAGIEGMLAARRAPAHAQGTRLNVLRWVDFVPACDVELNTIDEPMRIYRQAAAASRMIGYAGPPSAKSTEVYTKYIIVDMYAKACQGMKAEEAVKWAAGELGKIYG
jgi:hypothetical protein